MQPLRRIEHLYRVRYDEADAAGRLRPSGILRYTQDIAWRHSEEAGFDRDWYDDRGMFWLVRNISLQVHASASHGDELLVSTQVVGLRHVWARRRAELHLRASAGPLLAEVDTDWVLLRADGRPARVPDEIARYFSAGETFRRDRVELPEAPPDAMVLETRVRPSDIDPLGHMNNAAYLDVVDDALTRMPDAPDRMPDLYQIGYVRAAQPASAIEITTWPTSDDSIACRINDSDGQELTRVRLKWEGS